MVEIKERNKCENCVHNNVCEFRTGREECVGQMEGRLDNCCCPDIFQFSFECKQYIKNEIVKDAFNRL